MPLNSKIEVRNDAALIISGADANIANSNIICKQGSYLEIKNGATLKKNSYDQIIIDDGAIVEYKFGEIIDVTQ